MGKLWLQERSCGLREMNSTQSEDPNREKGGRTKIPDLSSFRQQSPASVGQFQAEAREQRSPDSSPGGKGKANLGGGGGPMEKTQHALFVARV